MLLGLSLSISAFAVDIDDLTQKAKQGHADAQFELANFYLDKGTNKDEKIGMEWLKKSAHLGHAKAQYYLGAYYHTKVEPEAFDWYKKAAEQGQVNAQYNLALLHFNGFLAIEKNPEQAFYWFNQAAKQGHIEAQNNLGALYLEGYGKKKIQSRHNIG